MFYSKLLLSLSVSAISFSASAQNACLSAVSNTDLATELNRRLMVEQKAESAIVTIFCTANGNLDLKSLNVISGARKATTIYTGSDCADYGRSLGSVANVSLARNILISTCDAAGSLIRTLVSAQGEFKPVSKDFVGSNCKVLALESNKVLRP